MITKKNEINNGFEKQWKEYMLEMKTYFNERHKSKLMRWVMAQDWHDETSGEHSVRKNIANLFFINGALFGLSKENKKILKILKKIQGGK